RFGLAAGVLLVPCTLMGATLPLIARAAIARADGVGRGAGALYAANTLGAVLGCVAAGFVLVPRLGLAATSVAAAAVNVAVGVVAFGLGRRTTAARTAARAVGVLTGASVVGGLALYARYDRLVPAAAAAMGGLGSWPRVVALVFGEAGAALLPTTLLLGATFPLVARLVVDGLDGLGRR